MKHVNNDIGVYGETVYKIQYHIPKHKHKDGSDCSSLMHNKQDEMYHQHQNGFSMAQNSKIEVKTMLTRAYVNQNNR